MEKYNGLDDGEKYNTHGTRYICVGGIKPSFVYNFEYVFYKFKKIYKYFKHVVFLYSKIKVSSRFQYYYKW